MMDTLLIVVQTNMYKDLKLYQLFEGLNYFEFPQFVGRLHQ